MLVRDLCVICISRLFTPPLLPLLSPSFPISLLSFSFSLSSLSSSPDFSSFLSSLLSSLPPSLLATTGLLNPLDCPHHMRADDVCPYREGIVVADAQNQGEVAVGSLVDCGLKKVYTFWKSEVSCTYETFQVYCKGLWCRLDERETKVDFTARHSFPCSSRDFCHRIDKSCSWGVLPKCYIECGDWQRAWCWYESDGQTRLFSCQEK